MTKQVLKEYFRRRKSFPSAKYQTSPKIELTILSENSVSTVQHNLKLSSFVQDKHFRISGCKFVDDGLIESPL